MLVLLDSWSYAGRHSEHLLPSGFLSNNNSLKKTIKNLLKVIKNLEKIWLVPSVHAEAHFNDNFVATNLRIAKILNNDKASSYLKKFCPPPWKLVTVRPWLDYIADVYQKNN